MPAEVEIPAPAMATIRVALPSLIRSATASIVRDCRVRGGGELFSTWWSQEGLSLILLWFGGCWRFRYCKLASLSGVLLGDASSLYAVLHSHGVSSLAVAQRTQ